MRRTAVNSEAKLLQLTQAFDVWGVQRVELKTDARNLVSRQAIEQARGALRRRAALLPAGGRRALAP